MTDIEYMQMAIELAKKGCGWVNPNPMVGAVIVNDGKIIGQGYHKKYGEFHAERNAIENCQTSTIGATLYVTLEPCCHYGKTPPCTEAIIESGICRVVIGSSDPNPLVAGKGAEILRSHGIEVTESVLKDECDSLNKSFFSLYSNWNALCGHEICHDFRWENCYPHRQIQVDYWESSKTSRS
jgi:diaminohydroxyphosphoribosylaminopyrimidine deaminase (EC 3.5.4.26)/5-amino-6-(5-phosphoribosylamino)uracil reductase (EC 1.1.1.193)